MDENENKPDDAQKSKNPLYVLREERFDGKTSFEKYHYYDNLKVTNQTEEYFRLRGIIGNGKELLPEGVGSDISEIKTLKDKARLSLQTEVPHKITQSYAWIDPTTKNFPFVQLTADDAEPSSFPPELYDSSMKSFKETQYSNHIAKLAEIVNSIYNFLTKYEIISKKPSIDDLMEERFKIKIERKMIEERNQKNKKDVMKPGA